MTSNEAVIEERQVSLSTRAVFVLATRFGILMGLVEVVLRLAQRATGHRTFLSADVVWMAPLADVISFLLVAALLLVATAVVKKRPSRRMTLIILVFVALMGPISAYPRIHWAAGLILAAGLASFGEPLTRRVMLSGWCPRLVAGAATLLVVLMIGAATLRWREAHAAAEARGIPMPGAPNVLLLVLDTVRSEDLSAYGYALPTTPELEAVAAEGALFERAYATAPWTLPSHASLFTGRYPHRSSADWQTPLGSEDPTLAEWFAARGYATGGFVGNLIYTTRETGLQRGFARYEDYPIDWRMVISSSLLARAVARNVERLFGSDRPLVKKRASDLRRRLLRWIDREEGPFFSFVNFMDAHAPYLPPEPFASRFGPRRQGPALWDLTERVDWTDEALAAERAAYDGAIAYEDSEIGSILQALRELGILDETLVVVVGDHGEQFGEKGLTDHGNSLYRTALEVPLVFRYPAAIPSGVRVVRPVSIRDVPQTIVDVLQTVVDHDIPGPAPFPGASLAPFWREGAVVDLPSTSPVLAEVTSGVRMPAWTPVARGDMVSVIADGAQYIRNGDGIEELYELEDRAQEHDLSSGHPERLARLRALVEQILNTGDGTDR